MPAMMAVIRAYLLSPFTDLNVKTSSYGQSDFALDGLRGIAVLTVIASHTHAFGMTGQGSLGVQLFFALSGYLLSMPFIGKPAKIFSARTIARFYANRLLRIMPPFVTVLLAVAYFDDKGPQWVTSQLLFHGGWSHLWSVAEEARFYMLFPVAIAIVAVVPGYMRMPALGGLIVTAWFLRNAWPIDTMPGEIQLYFWLFLTGSLACFAAPYLRFPLFGTASFVVLVAIVGLSDFAIEHFWRRVMPWIPSGTSINGWHQPEIWGAAFAVLLLGVTNAPRSWASRIVRTWSLRHIGLLSYGLYLFHVPVLLKLRHLELTGALHFIVVLAGSYVVALVSYVVIEKPFLMLKLKSSQPSSIEIDAFYRGTEANVAPAATKK